MGIQYSSSDINLHWNYFLMLEEDFQTLSKYVEPCEENNNTYSVALARIIMSSAQEVDVILKSLCKSLDSGCNPSKINAYHPILINHLNDIFSEEVFVKRFSMSSKPFSSWENNKPPLWWTANNKIKHHRVTDYKKANLKNAFNSLGGLFILVLFFNKIVSERSSPEKELTWPETIEKLNPKSNLFRLKDERHFATITQEEVGAIFFK